MDIFKEFLYPVNLFLSILLGFVFLYWLLVIIGAVDLEALDFDLDADVDVDADADADVEVGGVRAALLHFINIGEVPLMVVLSVLLFSMWSIAFLVGHFFQIHSLVLSIVLLIPNFLISFFLSGLVTRPLRLVFRALNQDSSDLPADLVGETGRVKTGQLDETFGQVEISRGGSTFLVEGRTSDGEILKREETALVVRHDKEQGLYIVRKLKEENL